MQYSRIAKLASRIQSRRAKRGQKGFTLLELLVVVAILAAIAGTATIALQDTDARASAAAHVAMMDELNKGIMTYRVLNKNVLPSAWDSLLMTDSTTDEGQDATWISTVGFDVADFTVVDLPAEAAAVMHAGGIKSLRYVGQDAEGDGYDDCEDLEAVITTRTNAVVPGNIFLSGEANGCGYGYSFPEAGGDFTSTGYSDISVALWTGNYERILGSAGRAADTGSPKGAPVMMAVGIGPSSTLFENGKLGSMTSVPVYRHVSGAEYNRFIALFQIGSFTAETGSISQSNFPAWAATDQVNLVTIIDGAGDTKEEELGEWDGQRNTI